MSTAAKRIRRSQVWLRQAAMILRVTTQPFADSENEYAAIDPNLMIRWFRI